MIQYAPTVFGRVHIHEGLVSAFLMAAATDVEVHIKNFVTTIATHVHI